MKKLFTLILIAAAFASCSTDEQARQTFETLQVGDSLFIDYPFSVSLFKKVRTEYRYYGSRNPKAPKDTIDFVNVNFIKDDYFYQNKTSFIGVASGVTDTTISNPASQNNDKWIGIKVDPRLVQNFLKGGREWNDGTITPYGDKDIGDINLYVQAKDVSLSNNDEKLK